MSTTRSPLARRRLESVASAPVLPELPALVSQEAFVAMVRIEQKRTERSGRYFILMLVDREALQKEVYRGHDDVEKILTALVSASRETDIKGWYREGSQLGVVFTEVPADDAKGVVDVLSSRVCSELAAAFGAKEVSDEYLSFIIFPEDWFSRSSKNTRVSTTLPDLIRDVPRRLPLIAKRALDIVGSAAAIVALSPVFVATALAVKLSSKGPVIFRQKRVGQHGEHFTFLKFRSMQVSNDPSIHREFVKKMIDAGSTKADNEAEVFKLTHDPRVTPIGRFLRKTSLDELPQFFNVLVGDMSLVGPRPPIPYEVDNYQIWHSQRLSAVKPGITGLWQVEGRSRVRFDDMVRMDLRYAKSWSLMLDLKILVRTPKAVLGGGGAC